MLTVSDGEYYMDAKAAIIIPARLAASRLPNKPVLDIDGLPMVIRVAQQSCSAGIADAIIACCNEKVAHLATEHGYQSVLTDPLLPSGTDRVYAALKNLNSNAEYVINVQGDIPYVKPETIAQVYKLLIDSGADIATAVSLISDSSYANNPNIVKAVIANDGRAIFFTRTKCPFGEGPFYKHIGIYGYKRNALEKFVNLPVSALEQREKLEQMRALENGMQIYATIVDDDPMSIDTQEDLEYLRNKKKK